MYNIRVYGILIEDDAVLVSDEYYKGTYMTKFPGGGHEIGEGLIDCLHREFKEELDIEIKIKSHFYTTDDYIASFFNQSQQLISIYYCVEKMSPTPILTSNKKFDFKPQHGAQSFRWIKLTDLTEDDLTYPIDKRIVKMLKNSHNL